jgi:hypothetical protein
MNLDYRTAKDWQADLIVSRSFTPPSPDTAALMESILQAHLRGLLAAAEVADDHEYLAAQGLVAIDGHIAVVSDKCLRLAEVLERRAVPDGDGPGADLDGPAETGAAP